VHYEKWDLQYLREKIQRSNPDRDQIFKQIRSIDRTKKIVVYHVFKVQEACDIDHLFSDSEFKSEQLMRYLLGVGSSQGEFEVRRIDAESNILGAIYNVRSLWEQFAFLVHDVLIEQKQPIHKVDLKKVIELLDKDRSKYPGLVNSLNGRSQVPIAINPALPRKAISSQ